jgi:hypothetical protein
MDNFKRAWNKHVTRQLIRQVERVLIWLVSNCVRHCVFYTHVRKRGREQQTSNSLETLEFFNLSLVGSHLLEHLLLRFVLY